MKSRLICSLVACGCSIQAFGQGQIIIGNRDRFANMDAPVFEMDCVTRLSGDAYYLQAYVGFSIDSLRPLGMVSSFRTGIDAGYISSYVLTIPGTGDNHLVFVQLRAWEASGGESYDAAVSVGAKHGFSNIVPVLTVTPPGSPYTLEGLRSFCLVPEPGPGGLLALGGGLWLLVARRRNSERSGP